MVVIPLSRHQLRGIAWVAVAGKVGIMPPPAIMPNMVVLAAAAAVMALG